MIEKKKERRWEEGDKEMEGEGEMEERIEEMKEGVNKEGDEVKKEIENK